MQLSPPPAADLLVIGALYAGGERGLASDLTCARALGFAPQPVCTQLVMAGGGRVTDVTDVPTDTVAAQLEHTLATRRIVGVKIGVLASHQTAALVLEVCESLDVPIVLDIVASGPSGETVLNAKGIDAVAERLGVATLVTVSKADAELVTGGEIASLDDAQVAAQRITNKGARAVLIRCGSLPYRFYDAADDPGGSSAITDQTNPAFSFDLAFDGEDFSLFEAPLLPEPTPEGAASAFSIAALSGFVNGASLDEALQQAKRYATEAVRQALPGPLLNSAWEASTGTGRPG